MAKGSGRKISGIYIPVELDTSRVKESLERVNSQLEQVSHNILKTFDKNLNVNTTVKNVDTLYRSLGNIQSAAKALSTVNTGDFLLGLGKNQSELRKLSKEFGLSTKSQKDFLEQAYKTQAINQEVGSIQALARTLGMAKEEFLEFAQARGLSFSKEAIGKLFPDNAAEQIKQFTKEYKELVAISGSNVTLKQFVDTKRIQEAVNATKTLNNSQQITKKQYEDIARATHTTTEQVKEYIRQTEKASKSNRNLFVSAFTPSNITAGLQSAASAFGVVGGAYGIAELTKSAYQASMKMENLNLAFKSIYGSADIARDKLEFVKKVSDELGISFLVSAEGAKKMFAASKGTVLENDVEKIFKAFSSMGAALKLTGAEMNSVFLAISQSISKGRLTAEEVRLQLAERMPGAVNLLAKSIGVTTAELDDMFQRGQVGLKELIKFAEEVQRTYGEGAKQASSGLQAELNRVGNAWFNLKQAFINTEGTATTLKGITDALYGISKAAPYITAITGALTGFATSVGVSYAAIKALSFTLPIFKSLNSVIKSALSVGIIETFNKSLGNYKIIIASLVIGGVYKLATAETEAEKTLSKYKKTLDDYIITSKERVKVDKEVAEQITNTKNNIEEALKLDINKLITPQGGFESLDIKGLSGFQKSLYRMIPTFGFDQKMFDEFTRIGGISEDLAKQFMQGFEKGMSQEELKAIFDKMVVSFDEAFSILEKNDTPIKVLEQFKERAGQFLAPFDELRQKSKEVAKELENIGANIDFGDAFTRLKNLGKILGDTEIGKQQKIEQETTAILENVIALEKQKAELQKVLETDKEADNAKKQAIQVNEQYQNVLAAIPSYLMKNNISIRDFTDRLIEMAKITAEATGNMSINFQNLATEISNALRANAMKNFENDIQEMQNKHKISEFLQKNNNQYGKAIEYLSKSTGKAPEYIANIVSLLDDGTISAHNFGNGIELTAENFKQLENSFSKNSGASKSISQTNNALSSLKDKLAQVNAELTGSKEESKAVKRMKEIKHLEELLSSGKVPVKDRAEYSNILEELKIKTSELIEKDKELKRAEGAEKMNEAIRRTNQELLELTGQGRQARIQVIKDSYDTELALWEEFKIKYNLSQEEFNEKVLILQQIRDAKLLQESTNITDQLKLSAREWYAEYENIAPQVSDLAYGLFKGTADAVGDFVATNIKDIHSLGEAFGKLVDDMYIQFARLFSNQMFSSLFKGIFDPIGGGGGLFSGLGNWISGIFSAKGNVFSNSPNLHKYSNSVIDKPTFFNYGNHVKAFAKGAGLMGEAGAEAVMPLIRTSSGHLGVRSVGSEKPTTIVSVNVINNSDAQVSTKQSQDNQGNVNLELMIEKQVGQAMSRPGSAPFKALNNNYNARMALANR